MKTSLKLAFAAMATSALVPMAQASTISIKDFGEETLKLYVDRWTQITSAPGNPGGGDLIDLSQSSDASHGLSDIVYTTSGPANDPTREFLSFTFANHIAWGSNVYYYKYFTEPGTTGYSDLFVIQGQVGTAPDYITFISDDTLTGNIATDGPSSSFGATPFDLGTEVEQKKYQLAFDTGVDQYYINSVPEPLTLSLVGIGLFGATLARRLKAG